MFLGFPGGASYKDPTYTREVRNEGSTPGSGKPLEVGMTAHYSILAWRIPWTEESGGVQSIRLQRVWTQLKQLSLQAHT